VQPPAELVERYHQTAGPMFDCIRNLQQRNANLVETRDLLLPKLISGEVSVEQLECEAIAQNA
jgi:type I restriction enzyme, S subunit